MKVLITGAAGFLGFHLSHRFAQGNHNLLLVDIAKFVKREYPTGCMFKQADIRDISEMNSLFKKDIDCVIHAAAALPLLKPQDIFDINVSGTENILTLSLRYKIKHFIFISSTAVYGIPQTHPIYENTPLEGVGPYGKSKIKGEKLCDQFRKKGLIITIIRPKTFVGTHRLGVFEMLFDWVKDGKKIPVIGSGENQYQLLDVEDLVDSIYQITVLSKRERLNDVFNVGAERFGTVRDDLNALFAYAHSQSTVLKTPSFLIKKILYVLEIFKLSPLYSWVYETADKDSYVSIEKIKKTLSWRPRYSNSECLIKAYQWYLDHYDEIKSHSSGKTHTVAWNQGILKFFKKFL